MDIHMCKNEFGHLLYTICKINSKLFKDPIFRAKLQVQKENTGENLRNIGFGNDFMDGTNIKCKKIK